MATLQNFLNDSREDINWEAIWYMVGHINYGGRVTDDLDRICLMSTLRKCLSPDLLGLSANEKYYYSDNEDYYCLNCHSLEDFQLAIERTLPAYDSPEVFGLHPNANISFLMRESARILQCVQLQDHKGEGARQNILEIISNLQQLPACIYSSKVHTQLQTEGETVLPSLTNFLLQ